MAFVPTFTRRYRGYAVFLRDRSNIQSKDIRHQIIMFLLEPPRMPVEWIDAAELDRDGLSSNPAAIDMLEMPENLPRNNRWLLLKNPAALNLCGHISSDWEYEWLCENPNAAPLLERVARDDPDKLDWAAMCANPGMINILRRMLEVDPDRIVWYSLSMNSAAIDILRDNPDKISTYHLCGNHAAGDLLEVRQYSKELCWGMLSANPAAMGILIKNKKKIVWDDFCLNTHPEAIRMIEAALKNKKMRHKVSWYNLSLNSAAMHILKANPRDINTYNLSSNPAIFVVNKEYIAAVYAAMVPIAGGSIESHVM